MTHNHSDCATGEESKGREDAPGGHGGDTNWVSPPLLQTSPTSPCSAAMEL